MATAVLLLTLTSLGLAAPAQAASPGIEFSTDGVTYAAALSGAVFGDIGKMVPGDTQTSTFWIRNSADSDGYLRLVLAGVSTTDPALAQALTLRVRTDTFIDQRVTLDKASPCWVLAEDFLERGSAVKVIATLMLGNLHGSAGQNSSAAFSVRAGLSETFVGSLPPISCGGASTGIDGSGPVPLSQLPASNSDSLPSGVAGSPRVIAFTGSEIPYPLLTLGAGALGVGLFLLIAARRRRQEDA